MVESAKRRLMKNAEDLIEMVKTKQSLSPELLWKPSTTANRKLLSVERGERR